MMKYALATMTLCLALFAEEKVEPSSKNAESNVAAAKGAETNSAQNMHDVARISEAFGHLLGKNLESIGFKFDIAQVIKGLRDASSGKDAPMTEMECVQAISAIQEAAFKQQALENMQKADEFMTKNASTSGVVTVEPGKIQYKVEQTGAGPTVEDHFTPLIRYTGRLLDGSVFGSSKEDEPISLDETIPGFTKGLIGMKEGEKRTLFIHPDMGYGASGLLPPNSLLCFEVEIVKANAPQNEPADALSSTSPNTKGNPEIASPTDDVKAIR